MTAPRRRRLRQEDPAGTRELILSEAMRLVARGGVEELRIKDIADAVGIQPPSVYKHFASRDAIIGTLARQMVDDIAQFVQVDVALEPGPAIEQWARGVVWFFATRPAYAYMLLRDLATPGGYEAIVAALGPAEETYKLAPLKARHVKLEQVIQNGVDRGIFRPMDAGTLSAMIYGAVLMALVWPYTPRPPVRNAAQLDALQADVAAIALRLLQPARA
ncbi:MAG TPA: TetR/AcrR family transcriptional regulator [Vineibacter sp.]|nr:TetR/AcrR family transcriptional regulator [Vineibacter sp.]